MNKLFKIYKKITNIFFYILIVIFVIYITNIFVNRYVYHDKYPRIFNYYVFNVASGSMEKRLYKGDFIVVKKTNDFEIGDIVTYVEDDAFITHRVIKIDGDIVTTKGDANNTEDPSINRNQVIGRFAFKSAFLTFVFKYRTPIVGLIIITIILGYLVELLFTKSINNQKEDINDDNDKS